MTLVCPEDDEVFEGEKASEVGVGDRAAFWASVNEDEVRIEGEPVGAGEARGGARLPDGIEEGDLNIAIGLTSEFFRSAAYALEVG